VPFPKDVVPGQPSALLQVWPEPGLAWEGTTGAKVSKATDGTGGRLAWEFLPPDSADVRRTPDGMVLVRNPDGTASFVRDPGAAFQLSGGFKPNTRQAVVRFKPDPKAATAKELVVSVAGTVRSGIEPLCQIRGLEANQQRTADGPGETTLAVTYGPNGAGGLTANVEVKYDPRVVQPVGVGDDLPEARGGGAGLGNQTIQGVRITDADGKPYTLGLSLGLTRRDPSGKRTTQILQLTLHADKNGHGPPAVATFWGTHAKPVEVPATLADVPLVGGK
jgi:hypothetical protein